MTPEIARDLAAMMKEGTLTATDHYSGRGMGGTLTGAISGETSAIICAAAQLGGYIERKEARGRDHEYSAADLIAALSNLRSDSFGYDTIWY